MRVVYNSIFYLRTFFLKDFTIEIKAEKQLAYDKPTSDRVIRRNNEFFRDKDKDFLPCHLVLVEDSKCFLLHKRQDKMFKVLRCFKYS
jgi:hypothetical protein